MCAHGAAAGAATWTFCTPSAAIKREIRADEISGNGHTQYTNKHINKEIHRDARKHHQQMRASCLIVIEAILRPCKVKDEEHVRDRCG